MPTADGPPLSLRPFPVADKEPKNLADFIARVNALPGGFRSVTEDKLQDEIQSQNGRATGTQPDDVDMSDAEDGQDDEAAAARDPNMARMEVLKNIE